ncbi:uncharacterized protein [Tursiops truncatus]|uniref:uncharacterized protein n=1 Tax=Tursiops truncatus TaxID=9739 RepID=UPI003CCFCF79
MVLMKSSPSRQNTLQLNASIDFPMLGGRIGNEKRSERLRRDAGGGRGRGAQLGTFCWARPAALGAAGLARHLEEREVGAARPRTAGRTDGGRSPSFPPPGGSRPSPRVPIAAGQDGAALTAKPPTGAAAPRAPYPIPVPACLPPRLDGARAAIGAALRPARLPWRRAFVWPRRGRSAREQRPRPRRGNGGGEGEGDGEERERERERRERGWGGREGGPAWRSAPRAPPARPPASPAPGGRSGRVRRVAGEVRPGSRPGSRQRSPSLGSRGERLQDRGPRHPDPPTGEHAGHTPTLWAVGGCCALSLNFQGEEDACPGSPRNPSLASSALLPPPPFHLPPPTPRTRQPLLKCLEVGGETEPLPGASTSGLELAPLLGAAAPINPGPDAPGHSHHNLSRVGDPCGASSPVCPAPLRTVCSHKPRCAEQQLGTQGGRGAIPQP